MDSIASRAGTKRKFDCNEIVSHQTGSTVTTPAQSGNNNNNNKRVVQDGFSWWTCLTMGVGMEQSKPHAVSKTNISDK